MKRYPYHLNTKMYLRLTEVTSNAAWGILVYRGKEWMCEIRPEHVAPGDWELLAEGVLLVRRNRRDDKLWHTMPWPAITKRQRKKARIWAREMVKLFRDHEDLPTELPSSSQV